MGGSEIDLNDAELAALVTRLNVYSIMGGAEVRVPDGVEVHVTNVAVMGGNDVKLGTRSPPPEARSSMSGWCRSWEALGCGEAGSRRRAVADGRTRSARPSDWPSSTPERVGSAAYCYVA
jgi:hypothetical protein